MDDDQAPGSSPVVVLSFDFWKNQFGSAQDIVGRKVLVNQYPMTVVGVAAPAFRGIDVMEVPSLWIPAGMSARAIPGFNTMLDRRTRWIEAGCRPDPMPAITAPAFFAESRPRPYTPAPQEPPVNPGGGLRPM